LLGVIFWAGEEGGELLYPPPPPPIPAKVL
jgi:hypothetical protein